MKISKINPNTLSIDFGDQSIPINKRDIAAITIENGTDYIAGRDFWCVLIYPVGSRVGNLVQFKTPYTIPCATEEEARANYKLLINQML